MTGHPVLEVLAREGVRLGLDRIGSFLEHLGSPHRCAQAIHVAGTNGKGSVCAYMTAALVEAGHRVGTTISPHVEQVNERVQIDGVPIGDEELAAAIEHVDRERRAWAASAAIDGPVLTYFEFITAVAFVVFATRKVDVMVVEVGMGGRLDATNVVTPLVCAIPSIGLDHVAELGPDLASIAREKAGIIKGGRPVVVGPVDPSPLRVLREVAAANAAPLWAARTELAAARGAGDTWDLSTPSGSLPNVRLGMSGAHQGWNAAVAYAALVRARSVLPVSDEAVLAGFARAMVPGRLEPLAPGLWIDGAHNPDGTRALAEWLDARPRAGRRVLVFGMGHDRDPVEVIAPLLGSVDAIVTTRCSHPKARAPSELARILAAHHPSVADGGPIEEALPRARAAADEVIVAGSLFVAGAARSIVRGAS